MHGGGGGTGPGGMKRARIEIIPLIDVIFFLLATFVLFTLSLNKSSGPPVQLPGASTGIPHDPNGVTITVSSDGTMAWNKDPVTLDEFIARIQRYHQENPDARILINGDERAFFAQAVYVFDQAHRAGFTKIFIDTHVKQQ